MNGKDIARDDKDDRDKDTDGKNMKLGIEIPSLKLQRSFDC